MVIPYLAPRTRCHKEKLSKPIGIDLSLPGDLYNEWTAKGMFVKIFFLRKQGGVPQTSEEKQPYTSSKPWNPVKQAPAYSSRLGSWFSLISKQHDFSLDPVCSGKSTVLLLFLSVPGGGSLYLLVTANPTFLLPARSSLTLSLPGHSAQSSMEAPLSPSPAHLPPRSPWKAGHTGGGIQTKVQLNLYSLTHSSL